MYFYSDSTGSAATARIALYQEGDWVEGVTLSRHTVMGYVEEIDRVKRQLLIRVIRSCCGEVDELEWAHVNEIRPLLNINPNSDEAYLRSMIDLALETFDEEWFNQLTARLLRIRKG
jgi:hypothetical protein